MAKITVLFVFLVGLCHAQPSGANDSSEVSCQCLQSSCGPCEVEDGVDFYSEKCGPNLSKTKSCKRPQCRAVENQKSCLAKLEKKSPDVKQSSAADRSIASADISNRSAQVILAGGRAFVIRAIGANAANAKGERETIEMGIAIHANDRIITEADGRVRLRFPELSEIFISPSSDVVVEEALMEKRAGPSKRTIMLDLHRGRVRSRVQGRYDDGESKFQVKTRAAVAGVRGTDFVVSFEPGSQDWKTEVKTLSGNVCLGSDRECGRASLAGPCGSSGEKSANICAGMSAAYVAPAPPADATLVEVEALMERGAMTPLYKMTEEEVLKLDRETDIRYDSVGKDRDADFLAASNDSRRDPSSNQSTCQAPSGGFNQCAWTCEGNPKGQKTCRTDLQGVRCVRRLCRASGQWAEPTVLPARQNVSCDGQSVVVKDCGGYW